MSLFRKKEKTSACDLLKKDDRKLYGKAWLITIGEPENDQGLKIFKKLSEKGSHEAAVALAMFTKDPEARKRLLKQAADAGNYEGLWEYCCLIPHSYSANGSNENDETWEKYCLQAAESGSADAMNEMGNIFQRRQNLVESMYWYAMANAHDHPQGEGSMRWVAKKWMENGASCEYQKGSPKFDKARFKSAICYLELYSDQELSISPDELIPYILNGVSIAGYFAGDIFENLGNYEMACKIYNVLCHDYDPHALKCYADMLFTGRGTAKNINAALNIYEKAAELGECSAMFIMGEFTREQDKYMAAYWYGLAHTKGYKPALERLKQLAH